MAGRLMEYRKFIDRGWLTPEDIVPADTLRALGFTHTDPKALIEKGADVTNVNLEGTGLTIPSPSATGSKTTLTPNEAAAKGYTHTRPLKSGGVAYGKTENGPWFDADGNPIGQ
jgi:hypothetical protein